MRNFIVLLRGINVGGKNKIAMPELRRHLEALGCANVITYIQTGNVLLQSKRDAHDLASKIETLLTHNFQLDSALVKVLVLTEKQLHRVIDNKPKGFGTQPQKYHDDVIFLMGIDIAQALPVFDPRDGVDRIWAGEGVIYHQRLSELRTKSRLSKIVGSASYQSMTVRSWRTTIKLQELARARKK
ncbi:MAG: DUF1697 domain-containing protein [Candidatus Saccharibacteria bacterium]